MYICTTTFREHDKNYQYISSMLQKHFATYLLHTILNLLKSVETDRVIHTDKKHN